ncbi:nuclear transport factor 2 family protein [Sphingomonas sp. ABOLE]|uniref:nuclear transport factor 2 family protein n=1 Tax=Sphingomonas sp. ABOLE TaxID=1985878 RepID=UPI000F7DF965|nr:nuclear transport factor 2 family protein [Sphingomonas sp. ABOLE]RSV36158.1 nuclear transport factor 2 family protein [Sphingomonas sp. ABOLE]
MSNSFLEVALGLVAFFSAPLSPVAPVVPREEFASPAADSPLVAVIEAAVRAEAGFDSQALAKVLADDYVEVSPVGEVDHRDAVLRFYDPANRRPAPQVAVTEPLARVDGSNAVVIVRLSFSAPEAAPQRPPMLMRATYVLRQNASGWRIASAQYTPIRTAAK